MFKIYDEPELKIGFCVFCVSCSCFCYDIAKRGGVFKIDDEPESANERSCCRYMMSWNRERGAVFAICDESESANEGVCFRYMIERNRQMRGRVVGIWRSGIAKEGTV